jgi:hypothetical protein
MKKQLIYGALLCVMLFSGIMLSGCGPIQQSSDQVEQENQAAIVDQAVAKVGMPEIHNFFEKTQLKNLYTRRDNPNLVCYAYLDNEMTGKLVYFGECMGYGIPYSTQYSNPEKWVNGGTSEYSHSLPQAEPNGLFMPSSSEGTWLMLVNPDNPGDVEPIYVEPRVIVSPFKLHV